MSPIGLQQVAMFLVIALLIVGARRLQRLGFRGDDFARLSRELAHHLPVFSAQTVRGTEAEFIRDRLPKRVPTWLALVAVLLGALSWWLSRF
jgi:hypothetical protein